MKDRDIKIKVITKARQSSVVSNADGSLTVKVHAAPDKGRANREVVALLAETFQVARSQVEIISGLTSKTKLVRIHRLESQK